ncbi:MAG: ABC transporter substrate-binding protein/permease [Polyangia bacterium]
MKATIIWLACLVGAPAFADHLDTIRASRELRWGADSQGGAPYVFQDPMDPNHLVGFEVELADRLAQRLGVRAHPVQGQWDQLLELLARGDFDVAICGIEVADEKRRIVRLSRPYYVSPERLTIRRGDSNAPRTLEAVRGRKVGTLPGSLAERILQRAGADVRGYDGGQNEIFEDLRLGRTDAVLLDDAITKYYGEIETELEVLPGSFGEVRYAIASPRDDEVLGAAIDEAIDTLARDGSLRDVYERWGLWNPPTAEVLGQDPMVHRFVADSFESWRAAVGKIPSLWVRLTQRYPRMLPLFARGAGLTLLISLCAMVLAVSLGVLLALGRTFGPLVVRAGCTAYIEFVRGTPLLVQMIMLYFGLPELGVKLAPFTAGCLALGLNYAAAEAENYRSGLLSVQVGQHEAAFTLGLSRWQTLRHVVVPQALRVALPPMTNDFIALLKDSSLVALVTLTELNKTYMNLANATRDHLGLGIVVAFVYLLLGLPFARLSRYVELRLQQKTRSVAR